MVLHLAALAAGLVVDVVAAATAKVVLPRHQGLNQCPAGSAAEIAALVLCPAVASVPADGVANEMTCQRDVGLGAAAAEILPSPLLDGTEAAFLLSPRVARQSPHCEGAPS